MASIFNIQDELFDIINQIEDNDGCLTPELEEQLRITNESLITKVESYANVIKQLEYDLSSIKVEKERLDSLKKSKETTIKNLKKILSYAIDNFGKTTKTGGKYIEWETGKVSLRHSKAIEIDEDNVNRFVEKFIDGMNWYYMQNQLDYSIINPEDLIEFANNNNEYDSDITPISIDNTKYIDAKINVNVNIADLLKDSKGFKLLKALLAYNNFESKASVSKTNIKDAAKNGFEIPKFAVEVDNTNVTIK